MSEGTRKLASEFAMTGSSLAIALNDTKENKDADIEKRLEKILANSGTSEVFQMAKKAAGLTAGRLCKKVFCVSRFM